MCGRFTLTWDEWRRVSGALGVDEGEAATASYRPRFNIAPTDEHFIVTSEFERRKVWRARWGLVNRWARDNRCASQYINAKAEKPSRNGRTFAKPFSTAVVSCPPMAFTNGCEVLAASASRFGFICGRRTDAFRWPLLILVSGTPSAGSHLHHCDLRGQRHAHGDS
jgi:hypothetical protein